MRGAVSLQGLRKSYGEVRAVRDLSLEIAPGEFLTLLGPSGCGKTTLLRLLAGFEAPDAGVVTISGRDLTHEPPYRRPVNTVFQHYALFPHRDVAGNVAFGLEGRGRGREEVAARVQAALAQVRLPGLGARRVDQLSGGQRQRVALARALVMEPDVLLLDEPLAALDSKLRQQMRVELKELQEQLGRTFVFVTHDQDEALVMSDRIAVMNAGRLEQTGPPHEVYERPRTRFVADFLGVRNLYEVAVDAAGGNRARLRTSAGSVLEAVGEGWTSGTRVGWAGVRPERLRLHAAGSTPEASGAALEGRVAEALYLGDRTEWVVAVGPERWTVSQPAGVPTPAWRRGDAVRVEVPASAVLPLAAEEDAS